MSEKKCIVSAEMRTIIDTIYPVGSYFWSSEDKDPSTFLGGTWEQVKDKFVLAAGDTYAAGRTGGEATHVLTVSELPKNIGQLNALSWANKAYDTKGAFSIKQNHTDKAASDGSYFGDATYSLSGGGASHNNMPPYITAYCWHRTV